MIQWFVEPTTFSRNNLYKGFVYDIISLTHHCDGILTHSYLVASLHWGLWAHLWMHSSTTAFQLCNTVNHFFSATLL